MKRVIYQITGPRVDDDSVDQTSNLGGAVVGLYGKIFINGNERIVTATYPSISEVNNRLDYWETILCA